MRHEGRAFTVAPDASLLTILVFRGGALAKAGHNHVIASHSMAGTVWVPEDPEHASFEIHVPAAELTIDEPRLRALEGKEFSADVPDSAREGTKKNMLSEAMLDGARFPEVVLRSERMERGSEGILAQVSVSIRGRTRAVTVPVRYEIGENEVRAQGRLALKQTDLGLTPFSLLGGALRVEDEMTVKFSVVARAE
ncbi:MAG: YceI family protein [Gammaproteobacteria bacterium]